MFVLERARVPAPVRFKPPVPLIIPEIAAESLDELVLSANWMVRAAAPRARLLERVTTLSAIELPKMSCDVAVRELPVVPHVPRFVVTFSAPP